MGSENSGSLRGSGVEGRSPPGREGRAEDSGAEEAGTEEAGAEGLEEPGGGGSFPPITSFQALRTAPQPVRQTRSANARSDANIRFFTEIPP